MVGVRVLLATRDRMFGEGLRAALQHYGIETLGLVVDGADLLELSDREHDVVIVEWHLRRLNALSVVRRLARRRENSRAIVLSRYR